MKNLVKITFIAKKFLLIERQSFFDSAAHKTGQVGSSKSENFIILNREIVIAKERRVIGI